MSPSTFDLVEESPTVRQVRNDSDSEEEDFEIHLPKYNPADFTEENARYITGEVMINVHSTGLVLKVLIKTLREMITLLNTIIEKDKLVTFQLIRKFILLVINFNNLELTM